METFCEKEFDKFELGNYEGVIADADESIQVNPLDWEAYYMRAGIKFALSDYRGAIEDLDKAIGIDPKSGVSYYLRGDAKYWSGDLKGAIRDWNRAMYIDPYFKVRFRNFIHQIRIKGNTENIPV